jgi:hypothetical protein
MKSNGFRGGHKKVGGRKPGTPNKFTQATKELYQLAFEGAGGLESMIRWIKKSNGNRTEFYRQFARLIPLSVKDEDGEQLYRITIGEHKLLD